MCEERRRLSELQTPITPRGTRKRVRTEVDEEGSPLIDVAHEAHLELARPYLIYLGTSTSFIGGRGSGGRRSGGRGSGCGQR